MALPMGATDRFMSLTAHERMVVAFGVLIDGRECAEVFSSDPKRQHLAQAALDLCEIPLQLRTPLVATALREARAKMINATGVLR